MPGVLQTLQSDGRKVQTLIFDRERFSSAAEAKRWAQEHDFVASKVDETESSFRLRQREPSEFDESSFATIEITEGVKAVVGEMKRDQASLPFSGKTMLEHRKEKLPPMPSESPMTWLDALRTGTFKGYRDPRTGEKTTLEITENVIDELVASVNESEQPRPIDGGQVSGVHQATGEGAASAAGWVLSAAKTQDGQGRSHLWVQAMLAPEVAAKMARGQLLFGSVAFGRGDEPESGIERRRLHSYALTNDPFIPGLAPHRLGREKPGQIEPDMVAASSNTYAHQQMVFLSRGESGMDPNNQDNDKVELEQLRTKLTAVLGEDAVKGKSKDELLAALDKDKLQEVLAPSSGQGGTEPSPASNDVSAELAARDEQIKTLQQKIEPLEKAQKEYEQLKARKAAEDHVHGLEKRMPRQVKLDDDQRELLVEIAEKQGNEAADKAAATFFKPPQGTVLPATNSNGGDNNQRRFSSIAEAQQTLKAEFKKQDPKLSDAEAIARAGAYMRDNWATEFSHLSE